MDKLAAARYNDIAPSHCVRGRVKNNIFFRRSLPIFLKKNTTKYFFKKNNISYKIFYLDLMIVCKTNFYLEKVFVT